MRSLIASLIFLLFMPFLEAQETPSPADTVKYYYCEMLAMDQTLAPMRSFMVSFGEEKQFENKYPGLKQGKFKSFLSAAIPLNILAQDGWQLVTAYRTTILKEPGDCYILRKPR